MTTTELQASLTAMQGMVDVLKMLEDQTEYYLKSDEESGLMIPPELGDYNYRMYTGLTACISIIKKELEKKF